MALPIVEAVSGVSRVIGAVSGIGTGIAVLAPTHRQCTIEIENNCSDYTLSDPRMYTDSGSCERPLPPTISPSKSDSALFIKTPHTACGSVGVFTYDLVNNSTCHKSGKIAIMFSNPYDFNLFSNWYAVGVFDMNKQCNYDLYKEMYYNKQKGFARAEAKCGGLTYGNEAVTIRATMSDSYQPVIRVQVSNN